MTRVAAIVVAATCAGAGAAASAPQRTVSCTLGVGAGQTDLPIPTLTPPPGVAAIGIGRGSDSASFRCSLRYESTLSTSAIAGHVNAQMTTLGWKPAGSSPETSLVVTQYLGTSGTGDLLTALLTVTALEGTSFHDVAVLVTRLEVPGDSRPVPSTQTGRAGGGGAGARGEAAQITTVLRGLLRMPAGSYVEHQSMPPGFPKELFPGGTEVRLAAVTATQGTAVGLASSFSVFEIPSHLVSIVKSGWSGRPPARGFSPSMDGAILRPLDFCRGTEAVTLEFIPLDGGGFAVRASHTRESKTPCGSSLPATGGFSDVPIPFLIPPGVLITSASSGGGTDTHDAQVRAPATVEPAGIVKELATQLTRGGWTIVAEPSAGDARVIRARNTSAAGDPVTALVVVTPLGSPSKVSLWLHVVRHKSIAPIRLPAAHSPDRHARPVAQE